MVAVAGSAAFAVTFSNLGEDAPTVTPTAATSECTQTDNLVVAVDPSIATGVEAVVATIDPEKLGCASFTVVSQDSARTYGDLALGGSGPAIWIPDSSEWLDKAGAAVAWGVAFPACSAPRIPAQRPSMAIRQHYHHRNRKSG